jgi:hypothetical protein
MNWSVHDRWAGTIKKEEVTVMPKRDDDLKEGREAEQDVDEVLENLREEEEKAKQAFSRSEPRVVRCAGSRKDRERVNAGALGKRDLNLASSARPGTFRSQFTTSMYSKEK